jgi:hypothetical protein
VVKNSVYLSSTSVNCSFCCISKLLLLIINFSKSTSDTRHRSLKSSPSVSHSSSCRLDSPPLLS